MYTIKEEVEKETFWESSREHKPRNNNYNNDNKFVKSFKFKKMDFSSKEKDIDGRENNSFNSTDKNQYSNNTSLIPSHNNSEYNVNPQVNIKVFIRIRPPLEREVDFSSQLDVPFRSIAIPSEENKCLNLVEYLGSQFDERERQREWIESPHLFQIHKFTYDYVYDLDTPQEKLYDGVGRPAIQSILEGYNSTIFAYGQTGTGKTFTMEGFTYANTDSKRGIIPRSIEDIFSYIEQFSNKNSKFMVRASYLQIYNDYISDLLKPEKYNLLIREDKKKGIYVEGLSEWAVRSPLDIYTLLQKGSEFRETSSTKMNDVSSRSHAVFTIIVEQMINNSSPQEDEKNIKSNIFLKPGQLNNKEIGIVKTAKLNLVDLAGSERISITGATGKQMEEGKKINKSLSALGNVIFALTDPKRKSHIPYRDSKLTRLIEDSLGGNCKTFMIATISPAQEAFSETLSTLQFARRAKTIRNKPKINEDKDQRSLLKQYEEELKKLKLQLEQKGNMILNDEIVMNLQQEKIQAEKDKDLALKLLEQTSKKYIEERSEKKMLEQKMKTMMSQVLIGGNKIEDTPQFQTALEEKHIELVREFDAKVQEIEKEKLLLEEDKAQVERYKQLLLKQRDIMIALTGKLNERDELIQQLQEDLEHTEEKYNKLLSDVNDSNSLKNMSTCINCKFKNSSKIEFNETISNDHMLNNIDTLDKKYSIRDYKKKKKNYSIELDEKNGVNALLTPEEKIIQLSEEKIELEVRLILL